MSNLLKFVGKSKMFLRLLTPPAVEPVTLEEALEQCHADEGIEDAWFQKRIKAGRQKAEGRTRRALITQVFELTLDVFPESEIVLPRPPLQEVLSCNVVDVEGAEHSVALEDLIIDTSSQPGRICLAEGRSWPNVTLRKIGGIKIQYVAGYGNTPARVPEEFKDAILLYVAHSWNNRSGELPFPKTFNDLLETKRIHT
jgi:uncharacterized phiE125 gp8 family phage protein